MRATRSSNSIFECPPNQTEAGKATQDNSGISSIVIASCISGLSGAMAADARVPGIRATSNISVNSLPNRAHSTISP